MLHNIHNQISVLKLTHRDKGKNHTQSFKNNNKEI